MIEMEFEHILQELECLSDENFAENMKKFGIQYVKSYGLRLPQLGKSLKNVGKVMNWP